MELLKHLEIFDPKCLQSKSVAVIGCGATGSMTALHLVKLGIENIQLYDDDHIEAHNIPNQLVYGQDDIGRYKSECLYQHLTNMTKNNNLGYALHKITTQVLYHEVVFFCVDTMKARKQIFDKCIFLKGQCKLLVDMRMSARTCLTYALDPNDLSQVDSYRESLYNDEDVKPELGNCGITLSVGATAAMCSSLAIWSFIDWMKDPKILLEHRWFDW